MTAGGPPPVRLARREWGPAVRDVRAAFARHGLLAVPLTLVSVALVAALQGVQHTAAGRTLVSAGGGVSAALPWWQALLRTPLSLFVPAVELPVWGALAQVLVVFGLAEIAIGRARTLAVAYLATLAGTLFARWAVAAGALGLGPAQAHVRDTGPSSAVVALAVCVAWRYRAWCTGAAVVAAMAVAALLRPDLAGWEHLVAVAVALACCAAAGRAAGTGRPSAPGRRLRAGERGDRGNGRHHANYDARGRGGAGSKARRP